MKNRFILQIVKYCIWGCLDTTFSELIIINTLILFLCLPSLRLRSSTGVLRTVKIKVWHFRHLFVQTEEVMSDAYNKKIPNVSQYIVRPLKGSDFNWTFLIMRNCHWYLSISSQGWPWPSLSTTHLKGILKSGLQVLMWSDFWYVTPAWICHLSNTPHY